MPTAQNIQKDFSAGIDVVAPMAKAIKSVKDVMVMETPECFMVSASFLSKSCNVGGFPLVLAHFERPTAFEPNWLTGLLI